MSCDTVRRISQLWFTFPLPLFFSIWPTILCQMQGNGFLRSFIQHNDRTRCAFLTSLTRRCLPGPYRFLCILFPLTNGPISALMRFLDSALPPDLPPRNEVQVLVIEYGSAPQGDSPTAFWYQKHHCTDEYQRPIDITLNPMYVFTREGSNQTLHLRWSSHATGWIGHLGVNEIGRASCRERV